MTTIGAFLEICWLLDQPRSADHQFVQHRCKLYIKAVQIDNKLGHNRPLCTVLLTRTEPPTGKASSPGRDQVVQSGWRNGSLPQGAEWGTYGLGGEHLVDAVVVLLSQDGQLAGLLVFQALEDPLVLALRGGLQEVVAKGLVLAGLDLASVLELLFDLQLLGLGGNMRGTNGEEEEKQAQDSPRDQRKEGKNGERRMSKRERERQERVLDKLPPVRL